MIFKDFKDFKVFEAGVFKYLKPSEFPDEYNKLRVFEGLSKHTNQKANDFVRSIVEPLSKEQLDIVSRRIILEDLVSSIDKGLNMKGSDGKFSFAFNNVEEIRAELKNISELMEMEPVAKQAYDTRNDFMQKLHQTLIDNNLIAPSEGRETYFHRRVMEYMTDDINDKIIHGRKLTKAQKDFMHSRTGARGLDYITNYIDSEFKVVADALYELKKSDFVNDFLADSRESFLNLKKQAFNEYEKSVNETEKVYGKGSPELQAIKGRKKVWINKYIEDNKPDGTMIYQPDPGNNLFRQVAVTQAQIEKSFEQAISGDNTGFGQAMQMYENLTDNAKSFLALGAKKKQYLVPTPIAETLNEMGRAKEPLRGFESFARDMTTAWKVYVLLNPRRVLKYNLNNMMGDFDGVVAGDPTILKKSKQAWNELKNNFATGRVTPMLDLAMREQVIDSGFEFHEINDIAKTPWAKYFNNSEPASLKNVLNKKGLENLYKKGNFIKQYFNTARNYTILRENWLRYAAFLRAQEKISKGDTFYWASNPKEVDAIKDPVQKAAKLSRDLLVDYGNISVSGQKIRRHVMPFYSWLEGNMKRYYRLLKNAGDAKAQARIGGVMLKKGVTLTTAKMLRAYMFTGAFSAMVTAWNKLMFPDEEKELRLANTRGMQFIISKTDAGKIITIPIIGAFYDAIDFFGVPDMGEDIEMILNGTAPVKGLKGMGKKMLLTPVDKLVQGANPFIKGAAELVFGQTVYPSVRQPRPIHDKGEYLSRFLSVQDTYNYIMDKPQRKPFFSFDRLSKMVIQELDPKEIAYYGFRKKVSEFKGIKNTGAPKDKEKSEALYNFGLAIRYGKVPQADKYLKKYYSLGGTPKDLMKSIKQRDPLSGLDKIERKDILGSKISNVRGILDGAEPRTEFGKSLTPADIKRLRMAIEYYNSLQGKYKASR